MSTAPVSPPGFCTSTNSMPFSCTVMPLVCVCAYTLAADRPVRLSAPPMVT
ncbi:hypothetical protein [Yinghuangia sp. YIM S09857]|uniref:hypothetical protein n=1 Tax=Yinghuangia sp. YIM S09857 TaxID=3436929 RepID=UPI003F5378A7